MPNESGQSQDTSTPRIGKNIAIITVLGKTCIIFWASGDPAAAPAHTPRNSTPPVAAALPSQPASIDVTATMSITHGTVAAAESSPAEATECR